MLMHSINNSMATGLIGKDVKFLGDTVKLSGAGDVQIHYDLSKNAQVTVKIYDETNKLVATLVPGDQFAGSQSVIWDGKGDDGRELSEGIYRFEIAAYDVDGNSVSAVTYSIDRIRGLKFDNGNAVLLLSDREIYLSDIFEVLEADN